MRAVEPKNLVHPFISAANPLDPVGAQGLRPRSTK
jgi:hypothetical protein